MLFSGLCYNGTHCRVRYKLHFSTHVHCRLNLRMYPFDQQICHLIFFLENVPLQKASLHNLLLNATDTDVSSPPEYAVSTPTFTTNSSTASFVITFVLSRYVSFHMFATYLPTSLLHFIGFRTLSIPASNFQDRGTMSLTTLLVLISLYTETLTALPITSYIKLIDVWFIFSITFLSLIISIHLFTCDVITSDSVGYFIKVRPRNGKQDNDTSLDKDKQKQNILNKAKYFLLVLYVIFIVSYVIFIFASLL